MEIPVEAKANSTVGGTGKVVDGLILAPGDLLIFTCGPEDTWKIGPEKNQTLNANGKTDQTVSIGAQGQIFNVGALVGSFDDGKTFFSIGLLTMMTVNQGDGPTLKLYCADSDNHNNSGAITVQVNKAGGIES